MLFKALSMGEDATLPLVGIFGDIEHHFIVDSVGSVIGDRLDSSDEEALNSADANDTSGRLFPDTEIHQSFITLEEVFRGIESAVSERARGGFVSAFLVWRTESDTKHALVCGLVGELLGGMGPDALLGVVEQLFGLLCESVGAVIGDVPAVVTSDPAPGGILAFFASIEDPVPLSRVKSKRRNAQGGRQVRVEGLPGLSAICSAVVGFAFGQDESHAEIVRMLYYESCLASRDALDFGPRSALV